MFAHPKAHGLLVSLPAIQDDITFTRETKREPYGFASIGDSPERFALASSFGPRACCHFLKDSIQRLCARVFSSQHREISQLSGGLCHHAAFGFVAQTCGAKDCDNASPHPRPFSPWEKGEHFSCGFNGNLQCIWCMRKINNGGEVLAHINLLHSTRNTFQRSNPLRGDFRSYTKTIDCRGQRSQTIRDV